MNVTSEMIAEGIVSAPDGEVAMPGCWYSAADEDGGGGTGSDDGTSGGDFIFAGGSFTPGDPTNGSLPSNSGSGNTNYGAGPVWVNI